MSLYEICDAELGNVLRQAVNYANGLGHSTLDLAHVIIVALKTSPNAKLMAFYNNPQFRRSERGLNNFISMMEERLSNFEKADQKLTDMNVSTELWETLNIMKSMSNKIKLEKANIAFLFPAMYTHHSSCLSSLDLMITTVKSEQIKDFAVELAREDKDASSVVSTTSNTQQNAGSTSTGTTHKGKSNVGKQKTGNDVEEEDPIAAYTTDLTKRVADGQEECVVGRNDHIQLVINTLSCRTKNNPILVGDTGVGRASIVRGVILRILSNSVPQQLRGKRVLTLDVAAIKAGATYQGVLESRIKNLLAAIKAADDILLYIPNMEQLLSTGNNVIGDMLKPFLLRGELRCIGTSTTDAFKAHIEADKAMMSAIARIDVQAATVEEAVAILRGVKPGLEKYHGIQITDMAIRAAVDLSTRYIKGRSLPEKAISLIDSAAARISIASSTKPEAIVSAESTLEHLLMQQRALASDSSPDAKEQIKSLTEKVKQAEKAIAQLNEQFNREQLAVSDIAELYEQEQQLQHRIATARQKGDIQMVAQLQYNELNVIQEKIQSVRQAARTKVELIRTQVTEDDIASLISRETGIPVSKMAQSERERLRVMESKLQEEVKGQDTAVAAVSDVIRRNRVGLTSGKRPIGSFLFLGTTGTGKTQLVKSLTRFMFDSESNIVRLDMGEFMEKHSASRLIGAPPGYVGYEEGGLLTEAVRNNPYSVVLLDEVEKAHPHIFDLLLPILDEGYATDSQGRKIDFTNTVIIMTSNLGAHEIADMEEAPYEEIKDCVMEHVRGHFRPEFINRIDEILVFNMLKKEHIREIVKNALNKLAGTMSAQKITLRFAEETVDAVTDLGYNPSMGARPVQQAIRQTIEKLLTNKMLDGVVMAGGEYQINYNNEFDIAVISQPKVEQAAEE